MTTLTAGFVLWAIFTSGGHAIVADRGETGVMETEKACALAKHDLLKADRVSKWHAKKFATAVCLPVGIEP